MSVEEIEKAISGLALPEYREFRRWLSDFDNKLWDRQMEEDAVGGRLDSLAAEALNDLEKGRCKDL